MSLRDEMRQEGICGNGCRVPCVINVSIRYQLPAAVALPPPLLTGKIVPNTNRMGGWVGLRASLDREDEKLSVMGICFLCRCFNKVTQIMFPFRSEVEAVLKRVCIPDT